MIQSTYCASIDAKHLSVYIMQFTTFSLFYKILKCSIRCGLRFLNPMWHWIKNVGFQDFNWKQKSFWNERIYRRCI